MTFRLADFVWDPVPILRLLIIIHIKYLYQSICQKEEENLKFWMVVTFDICQNDNNDVYVSLKKWSKV